MDNKNKNPLLAGLINVLIPGSSHLYVNKDWGRFIRAFFAGVGAYVVVILLGNLVEHTRGYPLPQGIFVSGLVMVVAVILFLSGQKAARERDNEMNDAAFYNSKRIVFYESDQMKRTKIQKMRDEGLISDQEYDEKNAQVASNKK
jgi:Na+/melibiose symporter-like transporter